MNTVMRCRFCGRQGVADPDTYLAPDVCAECLAAKLPAIISAVRLKWMGRPTVTEPAPILTKIGAEGRFNPSLEAREELEEKLRRLGIRADAVTQLRWALSEMVGCDDLASPNCCHGHRWAWKNETAEYPDFNRTNHEGKSWQEHIKDAGGWN